jgi:phosphoribosylanthranilate isomerase
VDVFEILKDQVFIKICGIKEEKDIELLTQSGVDGIGFVVGKVNSKRRITANKARELISMARGNGLTSFFVTTSTSSEEIIRIIEHIKPDAIQLHGDITSEEVEKIKEDFSGKIFKVLKVPIKAENPEIEAKKLLFLQQIYEVDGLVLDTDLLEGGTGIPHDWRVSREVIQGSSIPVILAGGLNPENVQQALFLRPAGVDVSSGVEIRGRKNRQKVSEFVREVKSFEFYD